MCFTQTRLNKTLTGRICMFDTRSRGIGGSDCKQFYFCVTDFEGEGVRLGKEVLLSAGTQG